MIDLQRFNDCNGISTRIDPSLNLAPRLKGSMEPSRHLRIKTTGGKIYLGVSDRLIRLKQHTPGTAAEL